MQRGALGRWQVIAREFRALMRVQEREPAPTTRRDPWYAALIALAWLAAMVASTLFAPAAHFDRPAYEIPLILVMLLLAGSASRMNSNEDYLIDHTTLFTSIAVALHGPFVGGVLMAITWAVTSYPERRNMGGWNQYVLGIANLSSCVLVSGWAFWYAYGATEHVLVAALALIAAGNVTNYVINVGWTWAGDRGQRELLRDFLHEVPTSLLATLQGAVGIAATIVHPVLILGLIAPLVFERLLSNVRSNLQSVEEELLRDGLTGIYNRVFFWRHLEVRLEAGTKGVATLMVDIDNFKILNDTHGHLEGDKALKACAHAMRDTVPADAEVARYGGEEFGVVVTGRTPEECMELGERLRLAAQDALAPWGTTISMGVAIAAPGDDAHSVTERADTALYASKHGGKNRVTMAPMPPATPAPLLADAA